MEAPTRESIQESIDTSYIMETEELENAADVLEHYGYISDNFGLTTDGRQYVELFQEYLQEKAKDSNVEHNSFKLINIEKLEVAFAKVNFPKVDFLGGWVKLLGGLKGKNNA